MKRIIIVIVAFIMIIASTQGNELSTRHRAIATIASCTATGQLDSLAQVMQTTFNEKALTVNEVKEVLIHTYAYCGFPRALQGLRTLVKVLDKCQSEGDSIVWGRESSTLDTNRNKYENGKLILSKISGVAADTPKADYAILAPEIEVMLKEHLFSDLFERDVLSYADREIATVAVIASLGDGVEPMLRSHSKIAINLGATPSQINEIKSIIKKYIKH